jgi:hypothetical protein
VVVDTRLLWEERQRLIEDVRQLADEVLATADDAMERVKMPEPLREPDAAADSQTAEVELDVLPGGAGEGTDELEPVGDEPAAGEPVELSEPGAGERSARPEREPRRDRSGAAEDDPLANTRRTTPDGE